MVQSHTHSHIFRLECSQLYARFKDSLYKFFELVLSPSEEHNLCISISKGHTRLFSLELEDLEPIQLLLTFLLLEIEKEEPLVSQQALEMVVLDE